MSESEEAKAALPAEPVSEAADGEILKPEVHKRATPESEAAQKDMSSFAALTQLARYVGQQSAAAPEPRFPQYFRLAAIVAVAAAIGSIAGALSSSELAHMWRGEAARSSIAEASTLQAVKSRLSELKAIRAELAQLSTLKANLDGATRGVNAQFAKLTDRLDRIEHAQIEPTLKLGRIAETVDRLEKREMAAPETTGSIANSAANSQTASVAPSRPSDKVLRDWIIQDAQVNRALVASRYGGVFEVRPGSMLPGLGRVEAIKRQDGQWIVVTARGVITER
jgi:hypothetical protein